MNRSWQRSGAVAVLAWLVLGLSLQAQVPPGLKDGDTFVLLGDSITHQCLYTRYVALYYYLHYPGTKLRIFNAGVGGDRATDGLARFNEEVLGMKPALVTVLLGMNDGGYRPFGEPQFGTYKTDMIKLIDRATKETQAKLVLLTPTFYDQEANKLKNRPGSPEYNDALVKYGDFLRVFIPVSSVTLPLSIESCTYFTIRSAPNSFARSSLNLSVSSKLWPVSICIRVKGIFAGQKAFRAR